MTYLVFVAGFWVGFIGGAWFVCVMKSGEIEYDGRHGNGYQPKDLGIGSILPPPRKP